MIPSAAAGAAVGTTVGAALGVWLAAATAYQVAAQLCLRRLLRRRPARPVGSLPAATILRPLVAGTPALEESLEGLCNLGAPVVVGVEIGDTESDAAVRRVQERDRRGSLTIVGVRGRAGANRKVAKLIAMLPDGRDGIAVLTDGDTSVPPGYLEAVLAPFADPAVGVVTCPYRSVGGRSCATRTDVLLTNAGFLPSLALAARLEGVRFALGATLAVRREVLDEIGGLEPLLDVLADDWAIADRARRAGHRIVLAPILLDHHVGAEGWRAVWLRHLRWARTVRAVRPAGYAGTIVAHGWAPALGLAALGGGLPGAAWLAAYALIRVGSAAINARRTGLSAGDLLLLPATDAVALALYVGGMFGRSVRWGGTRFSLQPRGMIRPAGEPSGTYVRPATTESE